MNSTASLPVAGPAQAYDPPLEEPMRAELPADFAAPFRARRLSAAGARVLVEGAVRVGDVAAVVLSGAAVAAWRFAGIDMPPSASAALIVGCLLTPNLLPLFGLYRSERLGQLAFQIPRVLGAWATTMAALIAVLFAMKLTDEVSRLMIAVWFMAGAVALVGARLATRLALARTAAATALTRQVAVVGLGEHLVETIARLATADPAIRVSAILDLDGSLLGRWPDGVVPLHGFADLERRAEAGTSRSDPAGPARPLQRPAGPHLAQPAPSDHRRQLGPRAAGRPRARAGRRPGRRRADGPPARAPARRLAVAWKASRTECWRPAPDLDGARLRLDRPGGDARHARALSSTASAGTAFRASRSRC